MVSPPDAQTAPVSELVSWLQNRKVTLEQGTDLEMRTSYKQKVRRLELQARMKYVRRERLNPARAINVKQFATKLEEADTKMPIGGSEYFTMKFFIDDFDDKVTAVRCGKTRADGKECYCILEQKYCKACKLTVAGNGVTTFRIDLGLKDLEDRNFICSVVGFKAIGDIIFDGKAPTTVSKMNQNAIYDALEKWLEVPIICKVCISKKADSSSSSKPDSSINVSLFEMQKI